MSNNFIFYWPIMKEAFMDLLWAKINYTVNQAAGEN